MIADVLYRDEVGDVPATGGSGLRRGRCPMIVMWVAAGAALGLVLAVTLWVRERPLIAGPLAIVILVGMISARVRDIEKSDPLHLVPETAVLTAIVAYGALWVWRCYARRSAPDAAAAPAVD